MKKRKQHKAPIQDKHSKDFDSWSEWRPFPDPRQRGYLVAPFGPGVYELRIKSTAELVLFGQSKNVAHRMTSLLPNPFGSGTRKNLSKKEYILNHLADIEYRTLPFATVQEAKQKENDLRVHKKEYMFST
jgi:hypothetical protein